MHNSIHIHLTSPWVCVHSKHTVLPDGSPYKPMHFANCGTLGIVYLLTCSCGCFYVSKTKLELKKRISRHVHSMKTCNPDLPLGRHVRDVHQGIFPKIGFLALDRIHPNPKGGDWDKTLHQRETCWIVALRATVAPGLNSHMSYRPIFEGYKSGVWEGEG